MSDKKTNTKSEVVTSLKTNGNSKLGKNFKALLSKPAGKLASFVIALVLIAGIAFGAYNQITKIMIQPLQV